MGYMIIFLKIGMNIAVQTVKGDLRLSSSENINQLLEMPQNQW